MNKDFILTFKRAMESRHRFAGGVLECFFVAKDIPLLLFNFRLLPMIYRYVLLKDDNLSNALLDADFPLSIVSEYTDFNGVFTKELRSFSIDPVAVSLTRENKSVIKSTCLEHMKRIGEEVPANMKFFITNNRGFTSGELHDDNGLSSGFIVRRNCLIKMQYIKTEVISAESSIEYTLDYGTDSDIVNLK